MDDQANTLIRHRKICFRGPHENTSQAQTATLILSDIEGILKVTSEGDDIIHISYDIQLISLRIIDELLVEIGLHLDNNLFCKLKRALYYYSEDAQRETLGYSDTTQRVFIKRYQKLPHGCRDGRPDCWRRYL
ncbi:MAG: hypothetical protein GXP22_01545 [Gammaproteobacteria bacterium]|nr:hypothetical protein [Gammaproteobacteria bacterium]